MTTLADIKKQSRAYQIQYAILAIHKSGMTPTAGRIQKWLGERVTHSLNGRDVKTRARLLYELGYESPNPQNGYLWTYMSHAR